MMVTLKTSVFYVGLKLLKIKYFDTSSTFVDRTMHDLSIFDEFLKGKISTMSLEFNIHKI